LKFIKKDDYYSVFAKTSDDNLDLNFGFARDIVRKIQEERKKLQAKPNEEVKVMMPSWPEEYEDYIKRKALIGKLMRAEKFSVTKND
jgi:valyl-tRNA synthetase